MINSSTIAQELQVNSIVLSQSITNIMLWSILCHITYKTRIFWGKWTGSSGNKGRWGMEVDMAKDLLIRTIASLIIIIVGYYRQQGKVREVMEAIGIKGWREAVADGNNEMILHSLILSKYLIHQLINLSTK